MSWTASAVWIWGACALSACSVTTDDEPKKWMEQQARQTTLTAPPIALVAPFQALQYTHASEMDPFNEQRLAQSHQKERQLAAAQGGLLAPEMHRNKESLEAFPLTSIAMVGRMTMQSHQIALVKVESLLYSVRVGSHLGQNFGRVLAITDQGISLRELVQDPAGKWIERKASLAFQERPK